jgi:hypothetical protein
MSSKSDASFQVVDKRHTQAAKSAPRRHIPANRRAHSVLLGYYGDEDARDFLEGKALPPEVVDEIMADHRRAWMQIQQLPPLPAGKAGSQIKDDGMLEEIARVMSRPACSSAYPPGEWSAELVEISRIIPVQPSLDVDYAEDLGGPDLEPSNLMAAVKLAFAEQQTLPFNLSVDEMQKSISMTSLSASFEVVGLRYGRPEEEGALVVSFMISARPNIITVSRFEGRNFLSTGYHRVYRMLKTGFTHVPCVVLEAPTLAHTGARAPGAFPEDVLMAPRPPLLPDFADPVLGVIVPFRAAERIIRIRPDEFFVFK